MVQERHEKLKKLNPFEPVYDNKPLNMVYLLSGEYGRIWQKERDEWYKNVFVPQADQKDLEDRKKKIRMKARAEKKAAELNAKERKLRRAKELEAKAKTEAEEAERLRERVRKLAAPKLPPKTPKKKKEKAEPRPSEAIQETQQNGTCPKGWKAVELTVQCECSDHNKERENEGEKSECEPQIDRTETSGKGCRMCDEYVQQLQGMHEAKSSTKESKEETGTKHETEAH